MASTYYDSSGKEVADGEIAYASDLNDINTAVDTAFQQVELDIDTVSTNQSYYSDLAEKWAIEVEDTEVETGKYSALHWAAKAEDQALLADADRVQTNADRVQTGLDKAATAADRVQTGLDRTQTGLDKVATAADRVQTGLDVTAASGYADDASDFADAAAASAAALPTFSAADEGKFLKVDTPYTNGVITGTVDLSTYAPLASPTFTGTPAAPTATAGTNTTQVATTAFVATRTSKLLSTANFAHIQDRKTNTTAGGSSSIGDNTRVLNTSVTNTITGSSLGSNQLTLPAGTYYIEAYTVTASSDNNGRERAFVSVDGAKTLFGLNGTTGAYGNSSHFVSGEITLASSGVITVVSYHSQALATNGLGYASSSGSVEVYTDLKVWKVA